MNNQEPRFYLKKNMARQNSWHCRNKLETDSIIYLRMMQNKDMNFHLQISVKYLDLVLQRFQNIKMRYELHF